MTPFCRLVGGGSRVQALWSIHRAQPILSCLHTVPACMLENAHSRNTHAEMGESTAGGGPGGQGYPIALEHSSSCCPELSPLGRGRPPYSAQCCSRRRNYQALCQMYEKIQPLLENLHGNFTETRNNIGEQRERRAEQAAFGSFPGHFKAQATPGAWQLP